MKVLVVGNGGREHALAWKLAQSSQVEHVFVARGNAGTQREPKVDNIDIDPLDFPALAQFVQTQGINFTVVGPEAPLVAGIVDYFQERQLACLGPSQMAAQLEGSKSFAKAFMQRNHIPTARAQTFTDKAPALAYLDSCDFPLVIKADGLAQGKGVVIAEDKAHAQATIESMLDSTQAAEKILIEDFIQGEEVSFIVLSDGEHALALATSQDHKTRDEGDVGPNTGGMGAYSPAPIVTPALHAQIMQQVIMPTIQGMATEGHVFKGFLYAGLMITPNHEIKVLEYNTRFGDPETQPILLRLTSDFATMCLAALNGVLDTYEATWDPRVALGVVLAANGYPEQYRKGDVITTLTQLAGSPHYKVFHAGTKMHDHQIVTDGGRILCVTALGDNVSQAQTQAYRLVDELQWSGVFCRRDIGHRALK